MGKYGIPDRCMFSGLKKNKQKKQPEGSLKTSIYSMQENIKFVATLQYLQQPYLDSRIRLVTEGIWPYSI